MQRQNCGTPCNPSSNPGNTPNRAGRTVKDERKRARTLREFRTGAERIFLVRKLREHDWNVTATAKSIETPRSNLYKKMEQYGIERESSAESAKAPNS